MQKKTLVIGILCVGLHGAFWMAYYKLNYRCTYCHYVYFYVCLPISLSACLSLYLSVSLSLCVSISLSLHLSISLCIYISVSLSLLLSVSLSLCFYVSPSLCLTVSISLSISPSFYLSLYLSSSGFVISYYCFLRQSKTKEFNRLIVEVLRPIE